MITLNPNFLEHDGQKAFVIIPYNEFVKIQEALEDYEDLKILRRAKQLEGDAPTISLKDAKAQLGIR